MNPPAHQIAQRRMNFAMPRNGRLSAESLGNDQQPIVPAFAGTGMPRVQGAVVDDLDALGRKARQSLADQGLSGHAGSTLRKGLTDTRA